MKITLALLAILALATATFAQDEPPKAEETKAEETKKVDTAAIMKKKYNVLAGVNFSSMSMRNSSFGEISWTRNPYSSFKSVFGFHAGGMIDIPLAMIDIASEAFVIGVHPGAQFIKKGGKRKSAFTGGGYILTNYTYTVSSYYLEVPVFASVKKTFSDNFAVRAEAGPYIAFGLFGTQKFVGGDYRLSESSFSDEGLERFDAGITYGATFDFAKRFTLGLHLGYGFSDDDVQSMYATVGYRL
jgi:hypothetical protein